ncbi:hypothetical protein LOD99_12593 [Oopsacas minuta]|uniref:Uncharacterized protein n=1 Tax=Oopsacas minuta TaxID=111878 RepID=A0AAV7JCG3_9METZ|nr:hypothetical protein LOD99_12593 [Oopsacas minuta]
MLGSRQLVSKGCNFVHNNEIWKDHVKKELALQKKWPDTWGFLSQGKEENNKKETVLEKSDGESENKESQTNYPQTDTQKIGYKVTELPTYQAEGKYGKFAKRKYGIDKVLDWSPESF